MGTSPEDVDTRKNGSDRVLLVSVIMLMIFGVLAVYSSIAYFAEARGTTAGALISDHIIKLGIAFLVMLIISKCHYRFIARFSRVALVFSWLLLLAVMVYGDIVFGARRSLTIGAFSFQPASFAAVALVLHVAVLLYEKQEYIKDFKRAFLPLMVWITITCGLIALQDFSSAALLLGCCLLLMFIGRISTLHIFGLVLIGLVGASALILSSTERQSRVVQYAQQLTEISNDEFEPGEGYQAQQAHIAIARGHIFGVGIGKSTQRDFLPAPYNDFIFAIITEEYGMIGAGSVILAFIVILYRGIGIIAKKAEDNLGTLLACGCTLMIALYGFTNAAVATGLFPVTGLPMPFVSFGGTSMLFTGLMIGILMNISKHNQNNKRNFYNS